MKCGRLRKFVDVERVVQPQDLAGQPQEGWHVITSVYANIEPMGGREYVSANQVVGEANTIIRMRALSGLTTKDRISWNGRKFEIVAISDKEERGREAELMCKEIVS